MYEEMQMEDEIQIDEKMRTEEQLQMVKYQGLLDG